MKTEPSSITPSSGTSRGPTDAQNEPVPTAFRRWMNEKVHLSISRGWLTGLAGAFLVLAMLALD